MKLKKLFSLLPLLFLLVNCSSKTQKARGPWHYEDGYRWAKLGLLSYGKTGFKQLSAEETGIAFKNNLTQEHYVKNRIYLNGSGVTAGDINGDGKPDLYFSQLDGPNSLYLNKGNFYFDEITKTAGVGLAEYKSAGTVFSDVDGDEDLDLLVNTYNHGAILLLNDGKGNFMRDNHSGLDSTSVGGTTMTLADIDHDGDLDLYIAHYTNQTVRDLYSPRELAGSNVAARQGDHYKIKKQFRKYYTNIMSVKGPTLREVGTEDELYLNQGRAGKSWEGFKKVEKMKSHFLSADGKPIGVGLGWGLTAHFEDINNDGHPDLYVCNDYWTPDQFWINQGKGVFKKINPLRLRHMSLSAMGIAGGDVNNDGHFDFFISDMLSPDRSRQLQQIKNLDPFPVQVGEIKNQPQYNQNSLFVNRGDNTFTETANFSGIAATGWSWASTFMDANLDGRQDILINTGYWYDALDLDAHTRISRRNHQNPYDFEAYLEGKLLYPPLKLENKAFKNEGNLRFSDASKAWGFNQKDVSQGLAVADFNGDGALDLVTNRMNQAAGVFENTSEAPRIAVHLIGSKPNTQAIGARVTLRAPDNVLQVKQIVLGGNYMSGSASQLMFAGSKDKRNKKLTIKWPNGKESLIDSVQANCIYEVYEDSIVTQSRSMGKTTIPESVFKDITSHINFSDPENDYQDYKRQHFIPLKLSQLGPGVSWIDYDGDGHMDLIETSGKGEHLAVYRNNGKGRFSEEKIYDDKDFDMGEQTAAVGWQTSKGTHLIVGRSDYEQASPGGPSAYEYFIQNGQISRSQRLPETGSSTGPLAAADYDKDGAVDLFVGGRVIPGKYPQSASSAFYKNKGGNFKSDQKNNNLLQDIGMVTGAVFTDYNTDSWPDLLISTSWGSVKIFENNHGQFYDVTKKMGLDTYLGWWNGIATGDFNGDGRPDFVATNWGTNSRYQLVPGHPMRMYYGNLSAGSSVDIIQANYDKKMGKYVPVRRLNFYSGFMPIYAHINSYKDYAESSLEDLLGSSMQFLDYKEINTLQSMVFINKNSQKFVPHALPVEAQITAGFDAGIGDYNNDGDEDIFISQNFFDLPPGDTRLDGGRGLWLQGDGTGNFKSVPGQQSGIKVYGEQRAAALGDFNEDGRIDLVVTQNGNATKLYENQFSKRGFSIRLTGPSKNLDAIGASIRLVYKDGQKGPAREIQAGSGYWSQNSSVQVMGFKHQMQPAAILVKWPDGTSRKVPLQDGRWNYNITY